CAKSIFSQLGFGRFVNLNDIRIHIGIPTALNEGARIFGGIHADAITIGNDIYFSSWDAYNPTTVKGLSKIGHELTHVQQQNALGEDAFMLLYAAEWARNGFRYSEGMHLEGQASRVERSLNIRIKQQFSDDPCRG